MSKTFPIISPDPLQILSSTLPIVEQAHLVTICQDALGSVADQVSSRLALGLDDPETGLGITGDSTTDLPLVLIEDFCNFCFWAEKDQPKWTVEWPVGTFQDGWYALVACFRRTLEEGIPILDPNYLTSLTLEQVRHLFRGSNKAEIPLLDKRLANLREAGEIIITRFGGDFTNWLETTGYDAVKIVQRLSTDFSCYRDVAIFDGKPVYFYKRAQWAAHSLTYVPGLNITGIDQLAAMADYKLPQILRHLSVFSYAPELAAQVDSFTLIPQGSQAELELRAATIWAVELLHHRLPSTTTTDIDNALWLLSQNLPSPKPYHRTYTIYY